ncbi:MAG: preprotein translocase subunit SecY [Parcubacteria group bacterium]|nr:preprotein translocase subunit SecY [Parcubacteria group bacterium]
MDKFLQIFKIPDLRKKIIFVLAMLFIFRLVSSVPMPGIDRERLAQFFSSNQLLGLVSLFTGGTLQNFSVTLLGLGPYITASIIMQLLTMIFPNLREMYMESGSEGRAKFNQYSRLLTVPLAALQSLGMVTLLKGQGIITHLSLFDLATLIITVTAGSLFLVWLGELITEKGIGNGVSLLIFAGIIAQIPTTVGQSLVAFQTSQIFTYLAFLAAAVVVIAGVVVITEGQRNIPVAFAKRVRGRRMYGGFSSHIPLRVNQAGVIPIIFALSILLFPGLIAQFLANSQVAWLASAARGVAAFLQQSLVYGLLYFLLVAVFTYFYTAVTFDPKAISENVQKQGGYVPGIRPGEPTAEFLGRVLNRITLVGAIFLGLIAVLPLIVQRALGITTLTLGGTALLIVVSVVLETMRQIKAQLTLREYETF